MARVADVSFLSHSAGALELASKGRGVSRQEMMDKLGIPRPHTDKLIEHLGLVRGSKDGRTEFFVPGTAATDEKVEKPVSVAATNGATNGTAAISVSVPSGVPAGIPAALVNEPVAKLAAPVVKEKVAKPAPVEPGDADENLPEQMNEMKRLIAADCAELGKIQARLIANQSMLTALTTCHLGG